MLEGLGSSPGSILYQLCDLTSPLSLVLFTSNRKVTPTLPTSQGCCEGITGVHESSFKAVKCYIPIRDYYYCSRVINKTLSKSVIFHF